MIMYRRKNTELDGVKTAVARTLLPTDHQW
jgi:hypothetical protein